MTFWGIILGTNLHFIFSFNDFGRKKQRTDETKKYGKKIAVKKE